MVQKLPLDELPATIARIKGPCLTAWAAEGTLLIENVRADPRWPKWSAAVSNLPVRSVVGAPLVAGKERIGALKVYAALLANIQSTEAPHRMSERLQDSLYSRDIGHKQALRNLMRQARPANTTLRQVSEHIVARTAALG